MKAVSTLGWTREEWLKFRATGIGGSEVAAVMGLSNYMSPLDVYNAKIDPLGQDDLSDNQLVRYGQDMEPIIAKWYAQDTGQIVRVDNKVRIHDQYDWMKINLDRVIQGDDRGQGVMEIKTTSKWLFDMWVDPDSDQVPVYYPQIQHALAITGWKWAVAVVNIERTYEVIPVEPDKEFQQMMFDICHDFWMNNVMKGIAPDPKDDKEARDLWNVADPDTIIEATKEFIQWLSDLEMAKGRVKDAEAMRDDLQLKIRKFKADKEIAQFEGQVVATWKNNKPKKEVAWERLYAGHLDIQQTKDKLADMIDAVKDNYLYEKPGPRILRPKKKIVKELAEGMNLFAGVK